MCFSDLEATFRFFERSGLGIPDSFIDSLLAVIEYSNEFVIVGNSLADSLVSFRALFFLVLKILPGGGGGMVCSASCVNSWVSPARRLPFFFYEWEHRTGTMCPFSSLHPLKKGKEV